MTVDREQITQTLIERLGLVGDPFSAPLENFFFVGGQRRFLVQQAVHALYFAAGEVLISGAEGAGKTRVLDEICRELGELVDVCRIEASVLMDANAIRARVAEELGLVIDVTSDASLLSALEQLAPEAGDPLPVLLAIDDAHQLAVPALAACHELVAAGAGRIRLLLVGAPELLAAWAQIGADAYDQLDVLPLDAQETLDYVVTNLQAAGFRGELPLSDAQQDELYRKSRGNLSAIHALVPELLYAAVMGAPGDGAQAVRQLPRRHLIIAGALVAVIVIIALFVGGDDDDVPTTTAAVGDRQTLPLALPATGVAPTVATPTTPTAVPPAPPATQSPPAPVAAPAPATPQPVQPKVVPAPVSAKPVAPAPAPAPAKPAPVPAPKPSPAPAPAPAASAGELAGISKDQFVIQLAGGGSRKAVEDFVARSADGLKVHVYETRRNGSPWFVAVTAPYPNRQAAQAAIPALPQALRDQKPWLRSAASIQADLKK